jgi:hypothetical protein
MKHILLAAPSRMIHPRWQAAVPHGPPEWKWARVDVRGPLVKISVAGAPGSDRPLAAARALRCATPSGVRDVPALSLAALRLAGVAWPRLQSSVCSGSGSLGAVRGTKDPLRRR